SSSLFIIQLSYFFVLAGCRCLQNRRDTFGKIKFHPLQPHRRKVVTMEALSGHIATRDDALVVALSTGAPYSSPSLAANLVLRVILSIIANIACIVPLRLLHRNGEFAAVIFIANVEVMNSFSVIYSLLWRDDNLDSWWPGYGLCDLHPYLRNVNLALYSTCLLAIIRNLAHQVGLTRVNPMTVGERRQRNLIQALIMFPLPLVQLAFIWPLTVQRYVVGTLVGCSWAAQPAWPYLVFYVLPPVVFGFLTAGYAVLMFLRYRQISQATESALSSNQVAQVRAQRAKRRLYRMVVSIMVPFLPMVCVLAVLNVIDMGTLEPFDYNMIHNHDTPYPWNTIVYVRSQDVGFAYMNNCYMSVISAIPIFFFFGMTKDAINMYRQAMVSLGMGRFFPSLKQEFDPDQAAYRGNTLGSFGSTQTASTTTSARKSKLRDSTFELTVLSSRSGKGSSEPRRPSTGLTSTVDDRTNLNAGFHHPPASHAIEREDGTLTQLPLRNPFVFRTTFDYPTPIRFAWPKFTNTQTRPKPKCTQPIQVWEANAAPPQVHTRVWCDDEVALCPRTTETPSASPLNGVVIETEVTRETHREP
ncbi:hypothetical protein S7711_06022, partial [Stachybotrys chartarum IBT 7711]